MRFIFQDNNGILFKQEKSEILENIMNQGPPPDNERRLLN